MQEALGGEVLLLCEYSAACRCARQPVLALKRSSQSIQLMHDIRAWHPLGHKGPGSLWCCHVGQLRADLQDAEQVWLWQAWAWQRASSWVTPAHPWPAAVGSAQAG